MYRKFLTSKGRRESEIRPQNDVSRLWLLLFLAILADQAHMMQPERACLGSYLLEYAVGFVSLGLVYFAWQVLGQLKKS